VPLGAAPNRNQRVRATYPTRFRKSSAISGISVQPIQKDVRLTGDDLGPDLAVTRDQLRAGTTLTFLGEAVTPG
jgi:hypothetical protein